MTSAPQPCAFQPGDYVWYLDEHDQRRAAVVIAPRSEGELIVKGVGREPLARYAWRVPGEDIALRLSPRGADEYYS